MSKPKPPTIRQLVLDLIRTDPGLTSTQIAHRLKVLPSTVSHYTNELLTAGVVSEGGPGPRGGRTFSLTHPASRPSIWERLSGDADPV